MSIYPFADRWEPHMAGEPGKIYEPSRCRLVALVPHEQDCVGPWPDSNLISLAPEMLAALQELEWIETKKMNSRCPCCGKKVEDFPAAREDHRSDCQLAELLNRAEGLGQ